MEEERGFGRKLFEACTSLVPTKGNTQLLGISSVRFCTPYGKEEKKGETEVFYDVCVCVFSKGFQRP